MAAEEHLGPQFFHGSNADLNVGDEIHPSSGDLRHPGNKGFSPGVHKEFVWMTPHADNATFFGKNIYQVEPQGLTNRFSYGGPGKGNPEGSHFPVDKDAHVSLAPARVVRKGFAISQVQGNYKGLRQETRPAIKWEDNDS